MTEFEKIKSFSDLQHLQNHVKRLYNEYLKLEQK